VVTGGRAGHPVRLTAWLHGRVQGVGMRWWVRARALELGLSGWARNTDDGRVEVVAEGEREAAERLLALLRDGSGRPGRVTSVVDRWGDARGGLSGFVER
jgi:acylphosphatase